MKCPNCGAEVSGKYCDFCGSAMSEEKVTINTVNNYYNQSSNKSQSKGCCPSCRSNNIEFKRERVNSTTKGSRRKGIVVTNKSKSNSSTNYDYRSIGLCSDCGYTWYPDGIKKEKSIGGHPIWWWILAIFIWPIFLSIWFYKTDKVDLDKNYKIAAIAAFWIGLPLVSVAIWLYKTEKIKLKKEYKTAIAIVLSIIAVIMWISSAVSSSKDNNISSDVESTTNIYYEDIFEEITTEKITTKETTIEETATKKIETNNIIEIDIIAGEFGIYGKEVILNEGTEFEDRRIGYFIPAGTYEVTNKGSYPAQATVYNYEKTITDGSEYWSDSYAKLVEVDETVEITIKDGYFFNCLKPAHFVLCKVDDEIETTTESTTSAPTTTEKSTEAPTTTEKITEAPTTAITTEENTEKSEMVWITANGKKYHSRSDCSNMKNPYQVSITDVGGRTACSKCY